MELGIELGVELVVELAVELGVEMGVELAVEREMQWGRNRDCRTPHKLLCLAMVELIQRSWG